MTVKLEQTLKYYGGRMRHLNGMLSVEKNIVLQTNDNSSGQVGKRYGKKIKKGNKSKGNKNSSSQGSSHGYATIEESFSSGASSHTIEDFGSSKIFNYPSESEMNLFIPRLEVKNHLN